MGYVMVPVPEEHLEEVERYVQWRSRRPVASFDEGPLLRELSEADEPDRALLRFVAQRTLEGEEVTLPAAARAIERSERETLGTVMEFNGSVRSAGGSPFTVVARRGSVSVPGGGKRETWLIQMPEEVCRRVLDAHSGETSTP